MHLVGTKLDLYSKVVEGWRGEGGKVVERGMHSSRVTAPLHHYCSALNCNQSKLLSKPN